MSELATRTRLTRAVVAGLAIAAAALVAASPASASTTGTGDAVLVGAGDIALCGSSGAEQTARLLDGVGGTVFTLGDNAQIIGAPAEYSYCYDPSWGRFKNRTRPAAGNHDYYWPGGAGYHEYFGDAAGAAGKGYYSYELGTWHVVVLNSNCLLVGGCGASSPQGKWLKADLTAHPTQCTVAYWHHPLFSSLGSSPEVKPLYQALYDRGAEIVMGGHQHVYERFAPQNPEGAPDARGVRQFVVGTGGMTQDTVGSVTANSETHSPATFGVLKLTLKSGGYSWEYLAADGGGFRDSGSSTCH